MENKTETRVERGFVKKANDCSNCKNRSNIGEVRGNTCKIDGYTVQKQSWCKSHELKEEK